MTANDNHDATTTRSPSLTIDGREIGPGAPPWIIAELSANHNGSLDRALQIVDAAADAGAHALKLQTYTADTMTLDVDAPPFRIEDPNSLWNGRTLYDLYREASTPWDWHEPIFARCRARGMTPLSSPFDATAIDFLDRLGAPCFKIASFEITDLPLIQGAAQRGKPLIISTGMSTEAEIAAAVAAAASGGCDDVLLLRCTSTYPADPADSHLNTIPDLRRRFGRPVGLSDHTPGIGAAVAAVALGAVAIEKHLTLRRADGGVDAAFSLEPEEWRALVTETERAWRALGEIHYGPGAAEQGSLRFRRSLWLARDVAAGEVLTSDHVRVLRPAGGLQPAALGDVIGRTTRRAARRGEPVLDDLLAPDR